MTDLSSMALPILAWLATYAVHSTVLLVLAWIVTSRLRAERAKQLVWRVALLGGIVTASTQALGTLGPARGADIDLADWAPDRASDRASEPLEIGAVDAADPPPIDEPARLATPVVEPEGLLDPAFMTTLRTEGGWPLLAFAGWCAGGLAIVGLFVLARRRLDRELVGARALDSGPLLAMLEDLRRRAGVRRSVRVSIAPRLRGPIATGVFCPRIWLPPRALTELEPGLQESMLGHELAHVARFDPLWLAVCRTLETLFFFQPLNRLARRKLAECAEYLCDEEAVRYTGDRLSLARCLAEVATWFVGRTAPLDACGMADRRSPLGLRVERILDGGHGERRSPWVLPLLAGALGSTVLYAPAFSAAASTEPTPASASSATESMPTASHAAPVSALGIVSRELDQLEALRLDLDREVVALREASANRRMTMEQRERLQSLQAGADRVNRRVDLVRVLIGRVQRIQEQKSAR